jgi:23S rRNA pseudouridine2605 synthase
MSIMVIIMNPAPSVNRVELESTRVPIRIQKILARAGVASRRACEDLIKEGRVHVNGILTTTLGSKAIPDIDTITIDGNPISIPEKIVIVFHKPRNVITSMFDPEGRPCVGDYLKELPYRLFPVGRLDFDVSGLIILTNDGDFGNKLLHPRYGIKRTYIARVKNQLTQKKIDILKNGIQLDDGFARVSEIRVLQPDSRTDFLLGTPKSDESLLELIVTEGRNHFVKNILETINLPVRKLSRTAFGPFTLQGISSGNMRQISMREELLG